MSAQDLVSVKHVHLLAGSINMPGASMLQLTLGYNPTNGTLNGEAVVTQVMATPTAQVYVHHVYGTMHILGLENIQQVFTIKGMFYVPFGPPPLIGLRQEKFSATFVTDSTWHGHCSFSYGNHRVDNVPVDQVK